MKFISTRHLKKKTFFPEYLFIATEIAIAISIWARGVQNSFRKHVAVDSNMQLVFAWILCFIIVFFLFFNKNIFIPCKILLRSVLQKLIKTKKYFNNIENIADKITHRLFETYTYSTWSDLIYNATKLLFFLFHLRPKGREI